MLRDPDDRMLSELPLREIWDRTGAPGYVVSRTDLQSILLEAVGAWRVRTGARCVGLDQDESGVVVHLEGGLEAKGDVAIGADGIHSAVRNAVAPGGEPSYAGIVSWVGIVPNDGLHPANVVTEYVGEGKRLGLSAVEQPPVLQLRGCVGQESAPARVGLDRGRRAVIRGLAPTDPGRAPPQGREPIYLEISDIPHLTR